jgi:hypothetical protein
MTLRHKTLRKNLLSLGIVSATVTVLSCCFVSFLILPVSSADAAGLIPADLANLCPPLDPNTTQYDGIDCSATATTASTKPAKPVKPVSHPKPGKIVPKPTKKSPSHRATPYSPSSPGMTPINGGSLPHATADSGTVSTILGIVFGIVGALALLMITVSGLRYVLSAGDPEKIAKAKKGIIYALVGLALAISAEAIVSFVVDRL